MKDTIKLEEFDFGFTLMDENELDAVQEVRQNLETTSSTVKELQEEVNEWKTRTDTMYRMVLPLLKNLSANPEKDYIYWPSRTDKIQGFIEQLNKVAGK